jgi:esterase/lipase superfamily enzyme
VKLRLFVTDHLPDPEKDQLEYGSGRSASVAFGSAVVDIGEQLSWAELGRFPETPHAFSVVNGVPIVNPEVQNQFDTTATEFKKEIIRRLTRSNRKDIVIYVHGFNNTFDESITNLAEIWHFMGRQGVPLVYSWPAAHGGLFGYFIDRESGEFTIFHLKNMLRLLASFDEVDNIHIIAHSRGTDVITTALRELIIEQRAAGEAPLKSLRIKNLILAAPDIDLGVMRQRLIAEKFGVAIGQITIYTAQTDTALSTSESIMTGSRLGRLESEDIGKTEKAIFASINNVNFINVIDVRSFISHAYYLDSPSASSDLIRVLRNSSTPGSMDRPLTHKQLNFWEIPPDYPNHSVN